MESYEGKLRHNTGFLEAMCATTQLLLRYGLTPPLFRLVDDFIS